jgi:hypothetical protein
MLQPSNLLRYSALAGQPSQLQTPFRHCHSSYSGRQQRNLPKGVQRRCVHVRPTHQVRQSGGFSLAGSMLPLPRGRALLHLPQMQVDYVTVLPLRGKSRR